MLALILRSSFVEKMIMFAFVVVEIRAIYCNHALPYSFIKPSRRSFFGA